MVKYIKGDGVKLISENASKITLKQLADDGWKIEGEKPKETSGDLMQDRDALKAEADALEIEYPKNIKTEKLYQLVWEAKAK